MSWPTPRATIKSSNKSEKATPLVSSKLSPYTLVSSESLRGFKGGKTRRTVRVCWTNSTFFVRWYISRYSGSSKHNKDVWDVWRWETPLYSDWVSGGQRWARSVDSKEDCWGVNGIQYLLSMFTCIELSSFEQSYA